MMYTVEQFTEVLGGGLAIIAVYAFVLWFVCTLAGFLAGVVVQLLFPKHFLLRDDFESEVQYFMREARDLLNDYKK